MVYLYLGVISHEYNFCVNHSVSLYVSRIIWDSFNRRKWKLVRRRKMAILLRNNGGKTVHSMLMSATLTGKVVTWFDLATPNKPVEVKKEI